jgi:hypothetical protein
MHKKPNKTQWKTSALFAWLISHQPPANSTFLSEQTSHQQPARTSQQYSSLRTNQHQPSATSQPNRLQEMSTLPEEWKYAFTKENEEDALVGREDQAVDKEAKQAEGQGEKKEARKKSTSPPT